MDSSGFGELTKAYTSAKARGCDVKLSRLIRTLDNLMQIKKLATVFDILARRGRSSRLFLQLDPRLRRTLC